MQNDHSGFFIADEEEIILGKASDVYFSRSLKGMEQSSENPLVTAEITSSSNEDDWITFTGLKEVLALLSGKNLTISAIGEGEIIRTRDDAGIPIPFITIEGRYSDIGVLETALLGLICQSSGISTSASRIYMASYPYPFFSFGIRRMHPAVSPMIDRAAYIGGAYGVSGILGAERLSIDPVGTMPHSLALIMGEEEAWKYIHDTFPKGKRTLLIDTFSDEKESALRAAKMFPDIDFIRLDTPKSRRGNFSNIVREIRWELNLRGYNNIKIMVSGGLDKDSIVKLREAGAEAFGVGTSISSAKPIDFSMDIVRIGDKDITKRGKYSGKKLVSRCIKCESLKVSPNRKNLDTCKCGGSFKILNLIIIENGKRIISERSDREIRSATVKQLEGIITRNEKKIS
ncbi:MAG: nicotinate phosphoribosyltransferase [Thermoplasmataceae archaeon]